MGKQRTTATLNGFFTTFGEDRAQQLKFICSDMWKPYLDMIAKKAAQALHVLDRFHIVAHMNKAIDHVLAQEARDLKAKGYLPVLKQSRWCLLKRPENRTEAQTIKLNELLQYNLKIVRSLLLKEDFQFFWEYTSPHWAGRFLDNWCLRSMRSKIEPMKKVARTLRAHRELLGNWFRARKKISAGMVEGFNNKTKLTTRKAYTTAFGPFALSKSRSTTILALYPSRKCPTDFADEAVITNHPGCAAKERELLLILMAHPSVKTGGMDPSRNDPHSVSKALRRKAMRRILRPRQNLWGSSDH